MTSTTQHTPTPHTMIAFGLCRSTFGYARQEEIFIAKIPRTPSRWSIYTKRTAVDPRETWCGIPVIGEVTLHHTGSFPTLRAALAKVST